MNSTDQDDNFVYLLMALIGLLFSITLTDYIAKVWLFHIVNYAILMTIILSVLSTKTKKLGYRIGIIVIFSLFLIDVAGSYIEQIVFNYVQLFITLSFFIFVAWQAAKQVLFSGIVNTNKIIGSICIYLLMGLIWALLYLLLLKIEPHAFNGIEVTSSSWQNNLPNAVYFSFVSLASLGYGEITPAFPPARFLAYMEAIAGQFYMAILVASLIGARVSTKLELDLQQKKRETYSDSEGDNVTR